MLVKIFKNQSIRNKLIVIIMFITTLVTFSGMGLEYYMEKSYFQKSIINNILLDAELISTYCVVPIEFDNKQAAHTTLDKLKTQPHILDGIVYTADGNVFASYHQSLVPFTQFPENLLDSYYLIHDNWIFVNQPIIYEGKIYGYLYLRASLSISEINSNRAKRHVFLILGMFLITLLLSYLLQKFISKPILNLAETARRVSKDKDFSLRVKKVYNDEIGVLFEDFNHMLEALYLVNKELNEHKEHLGKLVNHRTLALKKANLELGSSKEKAESANIAKGEFLSSMSHELRTPLNGIMGYAQILKNTGNLEPQQFEQVEIIHNSGKHLLSLINEILDYSRIEAHKVELQIEEFCLTDLIRHVMNIIRLRAEQKDLLLELDKQSEIPDFVRGDEVKIRQVLINLLNNAVKYTKSGKIILRIHFDETKAHNLNIAIEDTGVGIPKNQMTRIFEPFTQIDKEVKFIEGTGLGLAITSKLIKLMEGSLSVESEENKGSIFNVGLKLPVVTEKPKEHQFDSNIIGYKGERLNILVVDDNLTNLSLLVSCLEPLGFVVHSAQSGQLAIQQFKQHKPQLILMDLFMPQMNGKQTIDALKELPEWNQCKIIGVTASVIKGKEQIDFITNCNGHLEKPIEINDLLSVIKKLLSIEWLAEDILDSTKKKNHQLTHKSIKKPEVSVCDAIVKYAEIGDFESITNELNKLEAIGTEYYNFIHSIRTLISSYRSEAIINFINNLKP